MKNKNFPWVATPLAIAISSFSAGSALASVTTDTSFGTNGIASLNLDSLNAVFPSTSYGMNVYPESAFVSRQSIVELANGDIVTFASRYEEVGTAVLNIGRHSPCFQYTGYVICTHHSDYITYGNLSAGTSKTRMSRFTAGGTPLSTIDINGVMAISALEQPDGKLVLMGNDLVRGSGSWRYNESHNEMYAAKPVMTSQILLKRFNADGSADTSFDGDGTLELTLPGSQQAKGLALIIDGKITVLSANFDNASSSPELWRLNSDGSIDENFGGGDGNLVLPIPNGWGLLKQQDDKLLVHYNDSYKQAYARFNTDGSIDSTFAGDGTLNTVQNFNAASPMLQQDNGKLLLAANNVYRYDLSGIYEKTFTVPTGSPTTLLSLAETDTGEVLVARGDGSLTSVVDIFSSNAIRNTTVSLDAFLASSYISPYASGGSFGEILLQSNGRLLVSGRLSARGSAILNRHLINTVKNDYNNDGLAGWIWKGVSNGNETASQNWQLTYPLYSNNWGVPNRFYHPVFPDQANWDIVTTGDFNKDGDADILWRNNVTAQWKIWQMQNGLRSAQNDLADFDLAHEWQVIGSGDTDKDGDDDIILNNSTTGEVIIWAMQDHALATTHNVGSEAGYTLNRIGDFNKDGDVDLLFRQNGSDVLITWELEANAFVTERALANTGSNYNPVCAGDFDKDGDDDIMLINSATTQEKWFVMENYTRTQKVGSTNTGFVFKGCGDYDGDGDADILWQRSVDDANRVVLQQNYGSTKQTVYTNAFGAVNGFVYRGNSN